MAIGRGEQIVARCFYKISRKGRRWLKRAHHKARRLAERRDPENAPTRNRYMGWAD